ncbi:MAG TPA: TonB-dependent receptor, partial [Pedobacter sp.]
IFTGRIPFVWIISQARYSGMYQLTQTWQGQQNTPGAFDPVPQPPVPSNNSGSLPSVTSVLSRNFKMPQTWKSSIGLDLKLPADFNGTLEAIFNRDFRGIIFKDLNLVNPVPLNIAGYPDNRLVYPAGNSEKFINPLNSSGLPDKNGNSALNAVVVSNSSKGYYFSAMAQIERKISSDLSFSLAYIKSTAKNYNDGDGDQTQSALNATPSVSGINQLALGYAGYVMPDRIVSTLTYSKQYAKHLKFSVGLIYQGANDGRFSYTYSRDFTRDGTNRSLIYVPASPSEIKFSPLTVSVNNTTTTYSSQQQSDAFFQYIAQDAYLGNRKGKYAERNGAMLPWRQQFDLRLSHDFFLERKGRKNTIQLSCDIINAGNLLNPDWGLKKLVNATSILVPSNLDQVKPGGKTLPSFQLATVGGKLVTETFRNDYSINSTYMMQFGIRYLFD